MIHFQEMLEAVEEAAEHGEDDFDQNYLNLDICPECVFKVAKEMASYFAEDKRVGRKTRIAAAWAAGFELGFRVATQKIAKQISEELTP